MKAFFFISFLLLVTQLPGQAQTNITPYPLTLSYFKTTNLIFPYAIRSVDRGSAAVLAQKAKGVDNILQLKAASKNFAQTNITVVTADGAFYSFMVDYAAEPAVLTLSLHPDSMHSDVLLHHQLIDDATLATTAQRIIRLPRRYNKQVNVEKMKLSLKGIYVAPNMLWLSFHLTNQSQVPFQPDYIRVFVQDRRRARRTAIQQTEHIPLYSTPVTEVLYQQPVSLAMALSPFTVPRTQRLVIQVGEHSGGRQLLLRVNSSAVLRARPL